MPEYRTPGVYIEEVSGGPRPVQASTTTDTGFVAVLTLPQAFLAGTGRAEGMYLPAVEETPQLGWNRAIAFGPLSASPAAEPAADTADKKGAKPAAKGAKPAAAGDDNRLQALIDDALPGTWTINPPDGADAVTIKSGTGDIIRFPVRRTMMNVKEGTNGAKAWDLAWGADESALIQLISGYALVQGVNHSGNLPAANAKATAKIDVDELHDSMTGNAPVINGIDGYHSWRAEFGEGLFKQITLQGTKGMTAQRAQTLWDTLSAEARGAWDRWLRSHPGIRRLELALVGFFENGGTSAYPVVVIQAHGAGGPNKRSFLETCYDGVSAVSMLTAPGLELAWQTAILEYAGPKGRADLFAIMEAPRYLLTKTPHGVEVDNFRWTRGESPYEIATLQTVAVPDATELRFSGYASDIVLDRSVPRDDTGHGGAYAPWIVVDNPLSTGPHDRFVIAPPSGHVAGVIAATDLKGGGGVHKAPANELMAGLSELVTSVSDREQGVLNMKGINIIRHRPGAGIRVWGARTTSSDAQWTYVNVRRLFLFVERSVRDSVNWAVFLPNNHVTRRDLADTIASFLFQLYNRGMLDGESWSDSFQVQCDRENNPDVDVRSGMLTVDVQFRPVFPAEFIRIRFRQTPMSAPA
jgi:hypothetical protein